jgi:hypothetical protein
MEDFSRKRRTQPLPVQESDRRRIGRVMHDDRGNAYLTWHDAPADEKREVLQILGDPGLKVKAAEDSHDPYARLQPRAASRPGKPKDLRKLGEWIKMMRELEARKRADQD